MGKKKKGEEAPAPNTEEERDSNALQLQQLYRSSKLCDALMRALEKLVDEEKVEPHLALRVFDQFDLSMREALTEQVKSRLTLRGEVKKYNNVQNVWVYHVKNVRARIEVHGVTDPLTDIATHYDLEIPRLKITSVDEKLLAS